MSAWSPWTEQDKDLIEKVQKKFVNMISGLSGKTYEERLKELKLSSLATRRRKSDLVETYKIINSVTKVDKSSWFTMAAEGSTRITRLTADPLNLAPKSAKLEIRKNFFSVRVVNDWNNLPSEVKRARSVNSFKAHLDKLMFN